MRVFNNKVEKQKISNKNNNNSKILMTRRIIL